MTVDPATLVISPEEVANKFRLVNPSQDELDRVADAIADCQADVEGYLKRPLVPVTETLTGINPLLGYDLDDYRAWPDAYNKFDDELAVTEMTPHPDGSYDVTFLVGLNGPATRPVVRYVTAHTLRSLREDEQYGFPLKREVQSLSAEGQNIQYVARPAAGDPGGLPKIESLVSYRKLNVFRRNRAQGDLWPNFGRRR